MGCVAGKPSATTTATATATPSGEREFEFEIKTGVWGKFSSDANLCVIAALNAESDGTCYTNGPYTYYMVFHGPDAWIQVNKTTGMTRRVRRVR
jgi:hypothetical protein